MNQPETCASRRAYRRSWIFVNATIFLVICFGCFQVSPADESDPIESVIQRENDRPGARDWQLTRVRLDSMDGFRCPWIEGYCSQQSVVAGESIEIMVSADPPQEFTIEIFRMGYYGGRGARLMKTLGPFQGQTQPPPPIGPRSVRECHWQPTTRLDIPENWISGVYLGRLTLLPPDENSGPWQSYVVFIVRDNRPADILFQCSDNTWQAYNRWPDNYSVYTHPKGNQGPGRTSASIGPTVARRSFAAWSTIRLRSDRASFFPSNSPCATSSSSMATTSPTAPTVT